MSERSIDNQGFASLAASAAATPAPEEEDGLFSPKFSLERGLEERIHDMVSARAVSRPHRIRCAPGK